MVVVGMWTRRSRFQRLHKGSVKAGGGQEHRLTMIAAALLLSLRRQTRPMRSTGRGRKASQMVTDAAEQQATARNMTPRKPGEASARLRKAV